MLIYLVFPTCQDLRPTQFARDNILTRFVAWFYNFDTNTNVCPSIHVLGLRRRNARSVRLQAAAKPEAEASFHPALCADMHLDSVYEAAFGAGCSGRAAAVRVAYPYATKRDGMKRFARFNYKLSCADFSAFVRYEIFPRGFRVVLDLSRQLLEIVEPALRSDERIEIDARLTAIEIAAVVQQEALDAHAAAAADRRPDADRSSPQRSSRRPRDRPASRTHHVSGQARPPERTCL